jgi:hypothetical protein
MPKGLGFGDVLNIANINIIKSSELRVKYQLVLKSPIRSRCSFFLTWRKCCSDFLSNDLAWPSLEYGRSRGNAYSDAVNTVGRSRRLQENETYQSAPVSWRLRSSPMDECLANNCTEACQQCGMKTEIGFL